MNFAIPVIGIRAAFPAAFLIIQLITLRAGAVVECDLSVPEARIVYPHVYILISVGVKMAVVIESFFICPFVVYLITGIKVFY